ncbi:hypothetical protein BDN72DRAFT_865131 [Pluteus cervinus]|uniref:Uncharacterized protein n=1 Tax=Pluteus cervinus TaxID=181527 RepID=A0ACD3A1C3_9AGAR|nr:hypothetical protein BDN72DRAFT_865131 [Pluteus cervinus]
MYSSFPKWYYSSFRVLLAGNGLLLPSVSIFRAQTFRFFNHAKFHNRRCDPISGRQLFCLYRTRRCSNYQPGYHRKRNAGASIETTRKQIESQQHNGERALGSFAKKKCLGDNDVVQRIMSSGWRPVRSPVNFRSHEFSCPLLVLGVSGCTADDWGAGTVAMSAGNEKPMSKVARLGSTTKDSNSKKTPDPQTDKAPAPEFEESPLDDPALIAIGAASPPPTIAPPSIEEPVGEVDTQMARKEQVILRSPLDESDDESILSQPTSPIPSPSPPTPPPSTSSSKSASGSKAQKRKRVEEPTPQVNSTSGVPTRASPNGRRSRSPPPPQRPTSQRGRKKTRMTAGTQCCKLDWETRGFSEANGDDFGAYYASLSEAQKRVFSKEAKKQPATPST